MKAMKALRGSSDFRRPLKSSKILEACHAYVRTQVDHAEADRVFAHDIATAHQVVTSRMLTEIAETEGLDHLYSPHHEKFEKY